MLPVPGCQCVNTNAISTKLFVCVIWRLRWSQQTEKIMFKKSFINIYQWLNNCNVLRTYLMNINWRALFIISYLWCAASQTLFQQFQPQIGIVQFIQLWVMHFTFSFQFTFQINLFFMYADLKQHQIHIRIQQEYFFGCSTNKIWCTLGP